LTTVLLIYPYFKPHFDRSVFRFPPLGISYIASSIRSAGHEVHILDCTFLKRKVALQKALAIKASIVGIYCMTSMTRDCSWFANQLRSRCRLLVAGGPMPTCDPAAFLDHFDVVVRGEGEQTMAEIALAWERGSGMESILGITFTRKANSLSENNDRPCSTSPRPFITSLDSTPFPARDLLPNSQYINYGKRRYGFSITTVMSTRGCPYQCEFCSNVIFGGSYRERSPGNVVDEIEEAIRLGYERISFADDVFTMNKARVMQICEEIRRRNLRFQWECLGRVDTVDYELAITMKQAGCERIFFGIESGNETILKLMKKMITTDKARFAVKEATRAGLHVGAFFILFYPGDTNETVLQTLRFALSLPVDYLGLTMPYPLPGTQLHKRVSDKTKNGNQSAPLITHFSKIKMHFGILKGKVHFIIKGRLGRFAPLVLRLFEPATDTVFKLLK
jgi:anaerobic magnesium-protoporphyrin IX monomethyl ester cyclase